MSVSSISGILQGFVSATSDVQGAALVSPDGLPLASILPGTMDEERTSAMSAAMLSLGERIGKELARGSVEKVMVEGNDGYGILIGCGEEAVLLVLASQSAKQGLLMLDIKRTVSDIKAALN
jgi:uncharacterized protein